MNPGKDSKLALFEGRQIRKSLHEGEWWFAITDIIGALTDSPDPSDYWKKMRRRDPDLGKDLQGGGSLSPPLPCRSKPPAACRISSAGTRRASSA